MGRLEWSPGHLQGRILSLETNHQHLKAWRDICFKQTRLLFGDDDEIDEDRTTLIGLFRLGNFLLEDLESTIGEVREIAGAGIMREQPTTPKGGE